MERVQKLLARVGIAARRKAEELIREGRVTINGRVAQLGDRADPDVDTVKVDGKRISLPRQHRYVLLNKPRGYLTAATDPSGRPTVLELIPPQWRKALFPVGRLDVQTEGLLLLTTDGHFAERVAHPRYSCKKRYQVKVRGEPEERKLDRLRQGIMLSGRKTRPAEIEVLRVPIRKGTRPTNSWFEVEIAEGRTRQIREMFARIGHPVLKLRRIAIGPLEDRKLALGRARELEPEEVELLLRNASRVGQQSEVRRQSSVKGQTKPRATSGKQAATRS